MIFQLSLQYTSQKNINLKFVLITSERKNKKKKKYNLKIAFKLIILSLQQKKISWRNVLENFSLFFLRMWNVPSESKKKVFLQHSSTLSYFLSLFHSLNGFFESGVGKATNYYSAYRFLIASSLFSNSAVVLLFFSVFVCSSHKNMNILLK